MDKRQLSDLLKRYLANDCSEEERRLVEDWYNRATLELLSDLTENEIDSDVRMIRNRLSMRSMKRVWQWKPYAAVLAVVISLAIYVYNGPMKNHLKVHQVSAGSDIQPGGNRAILTFDDADTVNLSAEQAGIVVGDEITYTDGTAVEVADVKPQEHQRSTRLMTIATPRGGTYRVTLSDGTKVWLNAASKLTYPERFKDVNRTVKLEGEAFFEVAKGSPFLVKSRDQVITVLGTSFNVSSYEDEPAIMTTLVTGRIKIADTLNGQGLTMQPGQQAIKGMGDNFHLKKADVSAALAWKNGLFLFQDADVEVIMRQLARWYDVDFEFEGRKPNLKLWGEVHRDVNAAQALEILTYFKLKYRVETKDGRRKIVIYT